MLIEIHFGPFVAPQVIDQQADQHHVGRLDELPNQSASLLAGKAGGGTLNDFANKELAQRDRNLPHYRRTALA